MVRRLRAQDIYEVLRLTVHGVIVWSLPEAACWTLSHLFGRASAALHPARTRRQEVRIAKTLVDTPFASHARRIAAELEGNRYELRFQYLRSWRPGGWTPSIEVLGADQVTAARAKGRGTIFWTSNFVFNDLVTKIAWHRLGLAVSHFSRPYHGFSSTRFGIRYLNAVKRGIEDRYLGERVMSTKRQTPDALRRMCKRLEDNGAVSFRVGYRGRRRARAAFLGTRLTLATAPLFMARTTGATLLPVFTLRTGPSQFEVTIGEPIKVPDGADGDADYAAAIRTYADMLAPFVLRAPGQWRGWAVTTAGMQP